MAHCICLQTAPAELFIPGVPAAEKKQPMKNNGFVSFVMSWELAASVLSQHLQGLHFCLNNAWLCCGDAGHSRAGSGNGSCGAWAEPGSQDLSHHPSQKQGSLGAPWQPQFWAPPWGWGQARLWVHGWAWLGGAHSCTGLWAAGDKCRGRTSTPGELKWGLRWWEDGGSPGVGSDSQGWWCPWGPGFWSHLVSFCSSFTDLLEQVAVFSQSVPCPYPRKKDS